MMAKNNIINPLFDGGTNRWNDLTTNFANIIMHSAFHSFARSLLFGIRRPKRWQRPKIRSIELIGHWHYYMPLALALSNNARERAESSLLRVQHIFLFTSARYVRGMACVSLMSMRLIESNEKKKWKKKKKL